MSPADNDLAVPSEVGCIECPAELPPKGLPTRNIITVKVNANLLEIAMEAREWLISQGQNDDATRARIARVDKAISDAKEMAT